MKKTYILTALILIFLISVFIMPSAALRVRNESEHKGFVTAIDIYDIKKAELPQALSAYKESGITAAVIRESGSAFDAELMAAAKNAGLSVALMLYPDEEKPSGYGERLEEIINTYGVGYLILKESENPRREDFGLKELISENGLVLVLAENLAQNGNEAPILFDEYFDESNGRLMRMYETLEESVVSDESYDAVYYQMLNSAHDRNTEFILVNRLTDSGEEQNNDVRTQRSIKKFTEKMISLGYEQEKAPELSGYFFSPPRIVYAAAAAITCLLALLCLLLVLKDKKRYTEIIFFGLAAVSFGISLAMPGFLLRLYPTAFAAVSACFLTLLVKALSEKLPEKFISYVFIFAAALAGVGIMGAVLCALLSGTEYYMCLKAFPGVKLALIAAPAASLAAVAYENGTASIKAEIKKNKIAVAVLVVLIGVYLLRSGNSGISEAERIIRNFFTELAPARPRTKEFLLGWPCLYLLVSHGKAHKKPLVELIFLLGVSILFSSAINSFCHVFTDTVVMYRRLINGFLFSLPVILAVGAVCKLLQTKVPPQQ